MDDGDKQNSETTQRPESGLPDDWFVAELVAMHQRLLGYMLSLVPRGRMPRIWFKRHCSSRGKIGTSLIRTRFLCLGLWNHSESGAASLSGAQAIQDGAFE